MQSLCPQEKLRQVPLFQAKGIVPEVGCTPGYLHPRWVFKYYSRGGAVDKVGEREGGWREKERELALLEEGVFKPQLILLFYMKEGE